MTGPGRPPLFGKRMDAHKMRVPNELWDLLADEARAEGVGLAEMLRRILAERYEEES